MSARDDAPTSARADLRQGLGWVALGVAVLVGSITMDRLEKQDVNPYTVPGLLPGLLGLAMMLLGGILTAIPRTRNFGLLLLGPVIMNILAFHVFLTNGAGLTDPPLVLICLLAAYLLWDGRKAFLGLAGTR